MPSTAIRDARYDPRSQTLTVGFVSGAVYAYPGVPQAIYEGLLGAASKGHFFSSEIRPRFTRFRRLRAPDPPNRRMA
jgi:hypothetical protein